MALVPARTKYRKHQRRRLRGSAATGNTLMFGEFGLQAMETGFLSTNQVESARKTLTHFFKRGGKVWLRLTADKIVTSKALGTRMGSGKGAPEGFVVPVRKGHIVFEVAGVSAVDAREAFRLARFKLPLTFRFMEKV